MGKGDGGLWKLKKIISLPWISTSTYPRSLGNLHEQNLIYESFAPYVGLNESCTCTEQLRTAEVKTLCYLPVLLGITRRKWYGCTSAIRAVAH